MIQLGVLLVAGGLASAFWREYRNSRFYRGRPGLPAPEAETQDTGIAQHDVKVKVFDDVGELHHYQRVSWYTLALAASGSWFYPPATLVSVPLLGYNTYHFFKTVQQSDSAARKAPLTVFEAIGITGSLLTHNPLTASILLTFSFGARKLLLQAGNITNNIGFANTFNPRLAKVWILRDGTEVEASVAELREGDVVVLRAGDTVAVEGKVLEGSGTMRQFSLSKQMKLVPKQVGDRVFLFTQLGSGCLHVRPT